MKRPTTTGGRPIPVLIRLTTNCLPGNLDRATAVPAEIPTTMLISVASPDTLMDRSVIPRTSLSSVKTRKNAFLIPSTIRSIRLPYLPRESSFLPASGKKRGDPYLSTPNVPMIFWTSAETTKSEKALAPSVFTFGHLAGFTWMT